MGRIKDVIVDGRIIFFVKQKTADEMRIIDWSSDVCSSDLDPGRHEWLVGGDDCTIQVDPHAGVDHARFFQFRQDSSVVCTIVQMPSSGTIIKNFPEKAVASRTERVLRIYFRSHQIGRALCRERVCKYV